MVSKYAVNPHIDSIKEGDIVTIIGYSSDYNECRSPGFNSESIGTKLSVYSVEERCNNGGSTCLVCPNHHRKITLIAIGGDPYDPSEDLEASCYYILGNINGDKLS